MRSWYWTKSKRDAAVDMANTLYRFGLNSYSASKHTTPTIVEMFKGFMIPIFRDIEINISYPRIVFKHNYYDGNHCYLDTGILIISWSY